jgi:hypothetical protein
MKYYVGGADPTAIAAASVKLNIYASQLTLAFEFVSGSDGRTSGFFYVSRRASSRLPSCRRASP